MTSASIFDLTGKHAIVTGTSAGIGNRLARTLILAGARVAAIARRTTELDDEATSTGRLIPINADLAEHDQVVAAANASLEAFDGRVDILVNNAAYIAGGVKVGGSLANKPIPARLFYGESERQSNPNLDEPGNYDLSQGNNGFRNRNDPVSCVTVTGLPGA